MATAAPLQPAAPRRGIKALLARHPLVSFFVMAYAFTWLAAFMPLVLSEDGAGLLSYRWPLGLYATIAIASFVGPFLSAFIKVYGPPRSVLGTLKTSPPLSLMR
jgi:hypothetical protein